MLVLIVERELLHKEVIDHRVDVELLVCGSIIAALKIRLDALHLRLDGIEDRAVLRHLVLEHHRQSAACAELVDLVIIVVKLQQIAAVGNRRVGVAIIYHVLIAFLDGNTVIVDFHLLAHEIVAHMHSVDYQLNAESVRIPCILYNIKGRTGVNLETETLVRLENDCPNIVAVKEASGSIEQMKEVIEATNDDFMVLSGDDNLALDLIKMNGDGVISVASNLFPDEMVRMIHSALDGDWADADRLDAWFRDFFSVCFIETNPIPIKTAMARMGWCRESFRLPMCPLEKREHRERLFAIVDRMSEDIKEGRI